MLMEQKSGQLVDMNNFSHVCDTPPKTNMEPENGALEKEIPLETILFRFHVTFRGCRFNLSQLVQELIL